MIIPADEDNFEAPILALKQQIDELGAFPAEEGAASERERLKAELQRLRRDVYSRLTPWQKTLVARHPQRPYTLDYVGWIFEEFVELHGDRRFADDAAIVAGFARFHGRPVCIVGHQKGRDTRGRIHRNFGMPRPEGNRKALRVMKLAEKFRKPVLTFVDTPGAYPGIGAEERGQAEAIAVNLREMARLRVPVVVTVIGEGGSGGALAIAVGDRVLMLEHAIYSVISPEGCASILFRSQDREKTRDAARSLRLTASDLLGFGVIDEIVPEAVGGAHADQKETAALLDRALQKALAEADAIPTEERIRVRYEKFRRMGAVESAGPA